jgi:hypothetical protein
VIAAGLLLAAAVAAAPVQEMGDICLTSAHIWQGDGDDVRRIRAIPVPETYRSSFTTGGCNQLIRDQLIEWHLAFGDEASTTAALAFFEQAYRPVLAAPERYPGLLRQAVADAAGDLHAHWPLPPVGQSHAEAERRLRAQPAVQRLLLLIGQWEGATLLADTHLRAAEFFRSEALLRKAERFVPAVVDAEAALRKVGGSGLAEQMEWLGARDLAVDAADLEIRLAVLRASLRRTPATLAAADAVLARHATPALLRAEDEERAPCNAGEMQGFLGPDDPACEGRGLNRVAVSYWTARGLLELARGSANGTYTARTVIASLLEPGERWATWPERYHDRLLELLLAEADADRAASLEPLETALRLVLPTDSPNRFRQVAARYLALPAEGRRPRVAAYLRETLARLDVIATAKTGGNLRTQ